VIEIRCLPAAEVRAAVAAIDRSERVEKAYRVRDGRLEAFAVDWDVPAWDAGGDGAHSVAAIVAGLEPVLERGGILLGAFCGERLAGVAVVEPQFEPRLGWLAFLHVSRPFRRRGVATALWNRAGTLVRDGGAASMYVSAAESESAVGFYLGRGCQLADPPHPELLAMEPDDVHLVVSLR
jgi:GNAT superfamily N-acetyltransferase